MNCVGVSDQISEYYVSHFGALACLDEYIWRLMITRIVLSREPLYIDVVVHVVVLWL